MIEDGLPMRRLLDILIASLVLLPLSPLLLLIAVAIRLDSPGNPFYTAPRVGKNGQPFRMWKFRTMVPDAEKIGAAITATRDPRITRTGGFLRRTKLDELPQFYNVLVGDLTLVGPRPEVPGIVALYTADQREVLAVKPGLTGPGTLDYLSTQFETIPEGVNAEAYYVEHLMGEKLRIDLEYVRDRTILSDFRMILLTLVGILRSPER